MAIFKSKPPVVRPRVSPSVKLPTKDVIGLARRMDANPRQAQRYAYKRLSKQGIVAKTPAQHKAKLQRAKGVAFRQHLKAKRATTKALGKTQKTLAVRAQKQAMQEKKLAERSAAKAQQIATRTQIAQQKTLASRAKDKSIKDAAKRAYTKRMVLEAYKRLVRSPLSRLASLGRYQ